MSITTKGLRHLSWTFEEAPRLTARATREHLNGTLFDETEMEQEEPPEETDLILHDDDDDDDAEERESTGTAVAPKSNAQNASCMCLARTASIHRNPEHQLFSRRCGTRLDLYAPTPPLETLKLLVAYCAKSQGTPKPKKCPL